MSASDPLVYYNGQILPKSQACLSIEDRGTLFGDGVYEVTRYYAGRPLAMQMHLDRLKRSLAGIDLPQPADIDDLQRISDELVQKAGLADAKVYWQITRGQATRDHIMPASPTPSVLVLASAAPTFDPAVLPTLRVRLVDDERWANCWIKSLMLLPNSLAKTAARKAGYDDAIFIREGRVTEGTSANAFIVRDGELWTHPADRWILPGITRAIVIELAQSLGIPVREQIFSPEDLTAADEVLMTGTTTHIAPVTHVNNHPIATATPGPITQALHNAFADRVKTECG